MNSKPALLWFRRDLRITDNPALVAACRHKSVVPVFIWSPQEEAGWAPGSASRWWLRHSLTALNDTLRSSGSRLILRTGSSLEELMHLVRESGAKAIYANRLYEPWLLKRDARIQKEFRAIGISLNYFSATLLNEPWDILNRQGNPFQVFTPFWLACQKQGAPGIPTAKPKAIPTPSHWPRSLRMDELDSSPTNIWAAGFSTVWSPGEKQAQRKLQDLKRVLADYPRAREIPSLAGTSRLSPHLHFGEIGPRQIWQTVQDEASASGPVSYSAAWSFLRQLGWREFAHYLLYHFPWTPDQPLRVKFTDFPWRRDTKSFRVWQKGLTGYPLVDAGMRELQQTGWMHNRVRMMVASFLVKDLLLSWKSGAKWFWDSLVDADLANNTLGWQWVAGCGADASPYDRIFNPVLQGEKYDRDGDYVRQWVPELKRIPMQWIHKPWMIPANIREKSGYPPPWLDHSVARDRALEAFTELPSSHP